MTIKRLGICFLHGTPLIEQLKLVQYAESMGFDSIWVTESQLEHDAISVLGAMATVTSRMKLSTGVVNNWTRGPALMAMTLATLHELSGGRLSLGIGSYWDPLAWKQGIQRIEPIRAMREYVEVLRKLLHMETVNYDGEIVKVRGLKLDLSYGVPKRAKRVPIYIGATGLKMAKLAGEIADGILLNACISVEYTRRCIEALRIGAVKSARKMNQLDRPQLLACSMMEDGDKARDAARYLVARYLGVAPHIMKASGVSEDLIEDVNKLVGGWPPRERGIQAATELVDDDVIDMLTVSGTAEECLKRVNEYRNAGVTCPILSTLGSNVQGTIKAFSEELS